MKGLKQVIRWELIRHIKNKQFWLTLLLTPVIFGLFSGMPRFLERIEKKEAAVFAVVDEISAFGMLQHIMPDGDELRFVQSDDEELARAMVMDGDVQGYFTLHDEFVKTGQTVLYMDEIKQRPVALVSAVTAVLQALRMEEQQMDPSVLEYLLAQAEMPVRDFGMQEGDDDFLFRNLPVAVAFVVLLFYLIMSSCSMLLQSALQEKRDRMSEVILSSIEPNALMGGKILGHFILGIMQITFWLAVGLPLVFFILKVPIGHFVEFSSLPLFIVFMLLGYLLFAAFFVGAGATMEDVQSASNSQGLVYMLPVLSFFFMGPVVTNPSGVIARFATFFPLTSPMISMLRVGMNSLAPWEAVLAIFILLLSTWVCTIIAAKLFRVGMLMYGKSASLKEIWKWIRYA